MTNITVAGLPLKTGTIEDGGYWHLTESGEDKKATIAQLKAKISSQYSSDINSFLGSANEAEGRANLSIDRRVAVDNADYTILNTDKVVAQIGTMSAPRTFSLPAASTVQAGAEIIVIDESGSVNGTNKITVQRNGTDTIDGATSIDINTTYGALKLICDGTNSWKVVINTSEVDSQITSAIPAGTIIATATITPQTGFLACNGAEVAISSYGNLATAIYVGDSNNADTDIVFGYKTNGSGTRSTSGTHIKLPDLRGEFIRGWDNGRGIDSGRKLGSYQGDAFQGFAPANSTAFDRSRTASGETYYNFGGGTVPSLIDWDATAGSPDSLAYGKGYIVSDGVNGTPRIASETRPRNIALQYIIKY